MSRSFYYHYLSVKYSLSFPSYPQITFLFVPFDPSVSILWFTTIFLTLLVLLLILFYFWLLTSISLHPVLCFFNLALPTLTYSSPPFDPTFCSTYLALRSHFLFPHPTFNMVHIRLPFHVLPLTLFYIPLPLHLLTSLPCLPCLISTFLFSPSMIKIMVFVLNMFFLFYFV